MRTYAAIFGLLVVVAGTSTAQQYRTSLNEGQEYTLKLMDIAANIEVVAHNGNEMVINASELPEDH
jgi:hypothetical protein